MLKSKEHEQQYTRRDQLRFAYDLAKSTGCMRDYTQLPEMVQLANEDKITAENKKIKINEKFRENYLKALEQPISEGDYYLVENQIGNFSFFNL